MCRPGARRRWTRWSPCGTSSAQHDCVLRGSGGSPRRLAVALPGIRNPLIAAGDPSPTRKSGVNQLPGCCPQGAPILFKTDADICGSAGDPTLASGARVACGDLSGVTQCNVRTLPSKHRGPASSVFCEGQAGMPAPREPLVSASASPRFTSRSAATTGASVFAGFGPPSD
jgi:hypothetical protein